MDYLARPFNGVQVVQNDALQTADISLGPLGLLAIAAAYTLTLSDMGKLVTNKGGLGAASGRIVTLPPTSASLYGAYYEFCDYSGLILQVQANAGQYIAIGDVTNLSSLAGYMINRAQYNKIRLTLLDTGVWVSDSPNSNWSVA